LRRHLTDFHRRHWLCCGRGLLLLIVLIGAHRQCPQRSGAAVAEQPTTDTARTPAAAQHHAENTAQCCASGKRLGAARLIEPLLRSTCDVTHTSAGAAAEKLIQ
jgi:hypothetical protein